MKKLMTLLFVLTSIVVFAQREVDETKWSLKDRLYVGGGFGLNGGTDYYGNKYFYVQLSPILGYMLTNSLSVGSGITYQYMRYSDIGISTNQYGLSPFVRYNFNPIFLQTEYNIISVNSPYIEGRMMYNRFLAGIGIMQPLGQSRGAVNALAMYDLLYQNNGVFASPWVIRIFFSY